jgi:hypothetical protein
MVICIPTIFKPWTGMEVHKIQKSIELTLISLIQDSELFSSTTKSVLQIDIEETGWIILLLKTTYSHFPGFISSEKSRRSRSKAAIISW